MAHDWSVADVARHFVDLRLNSFAVAVEREEIDGESLLTLSKSDVKELAPTAPWTEQMAVATCIAELRTGVACSCTPLQKGLDGEPPRSASASLSKASAASAASASESGNQSQSGTTTASAAGGDTDLADALLAAVEAMELPAFVSRRDGTLLLVNDAAAAKGVVRSAMVGAMADVVAGGDEAWHALREAGNERLVLLPNAAGLDCAWRVSARADADGSELFVMLVEKCGKNAAAFVKRRNSRQRVAKGGSLSELNSQSSRSQKKSSSRNADASLTTSQDDDSNASARHRSKATLAAALGDEGIISRSRGSSFSESENSLNAPSEDSESSDDAASGSGSLPKQRVSDVYVRVIAIQDHVITGRSRKLSFRKDEAFTVLASSMSNDEEWIGQHKGARGVFPAAAVNVIGKD